jgi:hypothetical protein
MPRSLNSNWKPNLRCQKAKGGKARAFIERQAGGKTTCRYFGLCGTPEAQQEYDRWRAEWLSQGRQFL